MRQPVIFHIVGQMISLASATEGLFFVNEYNNQPPKHLTTYLDDVIEFVSFLSNRQSGAVGMPNVLIWAYLFLET